MNPASAAVFAYHERTKHSFNHYAKGPETIDWDDQPDAFRRFSGCKTIALTKPGRALPVKFSDLDQPEIVTPAPFNLDSVALLLELAFGLSAWKEFGPSRWSLRCNPSSGNLHPTEVYLINSGGGFLEPGVYHYVSHDHVLEQRAVFAKPDEQALFLGLSSVHWREAWKYGERAFRYCQHDVGHALGALRYAVATLGWSIELLPNYADNEIAALLGVDRDDFKKQEHEFADVLCRIHPQVGFSTTSSEKILAQLQAAIWAGKAESLKAYHMYHWPVIEEVTKATEKPHTQEDQPAFNRNKPLPGVCLQSATTIIRQRRSAQQFDSKMPPLPIDAFYRMLSATLPETAAFDFWRWPVNTHLFIFVHRVEGLTPGLYAFVRNPNVLESLKNQLLADFIWQKQSHEFPFYHLYTGDLRQIAKSLSCHQPIASDSAFSLGMLAEFKNPIEREPWQYRRLFWECGLIGQVLYLEAEAAGVRGTGIGCFFDDSVHEILGIKNNTWQSLYHFTVGRPLEDKRLQTLPAYGHLGVGS